MEPPVPPETMCFVIIYKLSELRQHQRAPADVDKSEDGAYESVGKGRQRVNSGYLIAYDACWA